MNKSSPLKEATTFAFSSVFIFLLCLKAEAANLEPREGLVAVHGADGQAGGRLVVHLPGRQPDDRQVIRHLTLGVLGMDLSGGNMELPALPRLS